MKKILIVCISVCVILFAAAGCAENIISTFPTDGFSTISSTQSTDDSSVDSSTQAQSTVDSVTSMPIQPSDDTTQIPSVPTKSEKPANSGGDSVNNTCKLIVKGKDITAGNHVRLNHEYRQAELPLTAIVKELGANVEWQDSTTAKITFDGKDFTLDATQSSFGIPVPPGTKHAVREVVGNEFVVDSTSAWGLIVNWMGAKISIDYDSQIINIG